MTEEEAHGHIVVEEEIQSETFEGGVEIVNKAARFVLEGIQSLGLDEIVKNNIELVVVEAIDNIVEHAYEGKGGKVKVSFQKKTEI